MELYCIKHGLEMERDTFTQSGDKFYETWKCPKGHRIRITHDANKDKQ